MVKKKETVFLSEGYYDETVKDVAEKNPWLLNMNYVDLNPEDELPACWNGSEDFAGEGNFCVILEDYNSIYTISRITSDALNRIVFMIDRDLRDDRAISYFHDWTKPTEQEKDYFEMIYGVRIPWSEEQPLVIDEDYFDDED